MMAVSKFAVCRIPDLDSAIPATREEQTIGMLRGEVNTQDIVAVTVIGYG